MRKILLIFLCLSLFLCVGCSNKQTMEGTDRDKDLIIGEWKLDVDYSAYVTFDSDGKWTERVENMQLSDMKVSFTIKGTYTIEDDKIYWQAETINGTPLNEFSTIDGHTLTEKDKNELNLDDYFSTNYDPMEVTETSLVIKHNNKNYEFARVESND